MDGAEPPEQEPIDRELIDRLIADPIDEDVQRELFGSDKPNGATNGDDSDRDVELESKLNRELGPAAVPEEANPLLGIARDMRQAEGLLAETKSGAATQSLQKQIVDRLDELIEQARKKCSQCEAAQKQPQQVADRQQVRQPKQSPQPSEGNRKPDSQPVSDPNAAAGRVDPQPPTEAEMKGVLSELWGELPQTERERMLELPIKELFLPKYEVLIQEYFRRLTEERAPGQEYWSD